MSLFDHYRTFIGKFMMLLVYYGNRSTKFDSWFKIENVCHFKTTTLIFYKLYFFVYFTNHYKILADHNLCRLLGQWP